MVQALCDTGSQITFITERCMQELGQKRQKFDLTVAGAGDVPGPTTKGVAALQLKSRHEINFSIQINAFVLAKVTAELPTRRIKMDEWAHLKGLLLSDPNFGNPGGIDLLIGADVWCLIVKEGIVYGKANEPHAQNTHLGWVISGPVDLVHCEMAHSLHMKGSQELEEALTRFWQFEEPQFADGAQIIDECEKQYLETTRRQADGRYVVNIPFINSSIS